MENYCAFSKDHKCILWLDYELTGQELEECHALCHVNITVQMYPCSEGTDTGSPVL